MLVASFHLHIGALHNYYRNDYVVVYDSCNDYDVHDDIKRKLFFLIVN